MIVILRTAFIRSVLKSFIHVHVYGEETMCCDLFDSMSGVNKKRGTSASVPIFEQNYEI